MAGSADNYEFGGLVLRRSCNYKYKFQFFNGGRAKIIGYFITTDIQRKQVLD